MGNIEGMTLRDYFAGQVIEKCLTADEGILKLSVEVLGVTIENFEDKKNELEKAAFEHAERAARDAYVVADAMLKERSK